MVLSLSSDSFAVFRSLERENFHRRLAKLLRDCYPDLTEPISESDLLKRINAGHTVATEHGIEKERGVAIWMAMDLMVSPSFHETPEVIEVFALPEKTPDEKIELIFNAFRRKL